MVGHLDTTYVASARLRVGVALPACGGELVVDPVPCDTLFVSKPFKYVMGRSPTPAGFDAKRVVVDVTDDPFSSPAGAVREWYGKVLPQADLVTCNGEGMAEILRERVSCPVEVVEDAVLGDPGEPRFSPGDPLRLVWYGTLGNLPSLNGHYQELAKLARDMGRRIHMTVLTLPADKVRTGEVNDDLAPDFYLRAVDWTVAAQRAEIEAADIVYLPVAGVGQGDLSWKKGRSPNRVAEALYAGRVVVAGDCPAYRELEAYAIVGDDLVGNVRWVLDNPEWLLRVRTGQERVAERYGRERLAGRWREVLCPN